MASTAGKVLGVFAKWPVPGLVKTRLAAESSSAWAAEVAAAFLRDTLDRASGVDALRILAFEPSAARDAFAAAAANRFDLIAQVQGDLGQRLPAFFDAAFAAGAQRVVVIGTDSPTMPFARFEQAWEALTGVDVVLGPATDGGYYLIGCARATPAIFSGITWSGCRVLAETVDAIERAGLRLALLEPWYDVDTLADWTMLRGHIRAMEAAGTISDLAHTRALCRV
jgi:uncharacterized protein